jgi:hypothetical protein
VTPPPGRPDTLRVPGWPEALAEACTEAEERAFAWGTHDCGLWARAVAQALTGRDPAPWLEGYATEEELAELLEDRGGLENAVVQAMHEFGAAEILPAFAQRGDWALVDLGNEVACGIVLDGDRVAVPGLDGLRHTRLSRVLRAWAI